MDFTSLTDSGTGSELEKFILGHASLQTGDKLEGRVIDVKPDGKLLIHFGRFRAVAEAQFPIEAGETIHVVVAAKYPKLKLKLETPRSKVSAENMVRKLEMIPEDKWSNVRDVLQKLLAVEDITSVLLPPDIGEALEAMDGHVKMKMPQPDRLALLLQMERPGPVRIDFHRLGSSMNITFYVKSPAIRDQIERNLSEVDARLGGRFQRLVLHAILSEKKIAEFDTEELDATTVNTKMLDLKA